MLPNSQQSIHHPPTRKEKARFIIRSQIIRGCSGKRKYGIIKMMRNIKKVNVKKDMNYSPRSNLAFRSVRILFH